MLHPDYFINKLDDLTVLYSDLHTAVLKSIARHVADAMKAQGAIMPSTRRQIEAAQSIGLTQKDIEKHVAGLRVDIMSEIDAVLTYSPALVRQLFEDAGVETLRYDNEIYKEAGLPPVIYQQSPAMHRILESRIGRSTSSLRRLTGTIAINSEDLFERTLNTAYGKVANGTHSYTEALAEGMDDLLREGVSVFSYASGRNISIEAAVLMNIRTGVSQAAAELTKQGMIEQGCTHVETSAHMGARNTGEGHRNHEAWQGKVFYWKEINGGYRENRDEKSLQNEMQNDILYMQGDESVRTSKLSHTLHDIESKKQGLDYEIGTLISPEGDVLKEYAGDKHVVRIPEEDEELFNGNVFTHNHPSGRTFTREDVSEFAKSGLIELRASTPQGTFFSLKEISTEVNRSIGNVMEAEGVGSYLQAAQILQGQNIHLTGNEYQRKLFDVMAEEVEKWLAENAQSFGYVYTKGAL